MRTKFLYPGIFIAIISMFLCSCGSVKYVDMLMLKDIKASALKFISRISGTLATSPAAFIRMVMLNIMTNCSKIGSAKNRAMKGAAKNKSR